MAKYADVQVHWPPWSISCYCIYNIRNLINSRLSCMDTVYLFSFSSFPLFQKKKRKKFSSDVFFLSYSHTHPPVHFGEKSIPCNWKHVHISECFMFNLLHGRISLSMLMLVVFYASPTSILYVRMYGVFVYSFTHLFAHSLVCPFLLIEWSRIKWAHIICVRFIWFYRLANIITTTIITWNNIKIV